MLMHLIIKANNYLFDYFKLDYFWQKIYSEIVWRQILEYFKI